MTDLPTIEGRPRPAAAPIAPTPPFPPPRPHKLGLLRLLLTLWRNPLDAWARPYFEQMIVVDRSILGEMAVINAPEAIRRVLADNSENYRKDRLQRRVLGKAMRDGLLLAEDRRWREQRRAAAPAFALRGVTEFAPAMRSAIDDLIARWRGLGDGAVVDVAAEAARLTLDVLTRTIFADGLGDDREQVRRHMRTYFDSVGRIDALDLLGLPAFLPRSGRGRVRRAQVFFDAAVQRLLATRNDLLAADPASAPHDLLTLLLASRQNGCGLTNDEIRANLVTFIAAGHETTANALTWSLFLLTLAPEWREGVAAEADGGEPAALVATRAVVDEALRLYPPLVALSREARAPDELAGQRIGQGALVVIAPYVLHRHRALWERPDQFDPSRFLGPAKERIPRFAYLPFGAGPRICIGAAFALQEATLALAALTRAFRFEVAPGHRVWPLQRVTLRPAGGLPMIVRRNG